jgi:hypothetical protein
MDGKRSMTREGEDVTPLQKLSQTDFPAARNVRRLLACMADLRRYGLDDLTVLEVVWALKVDRIRRIGYTEYLHEVLGGWAKHPTKKCRLWKQGEEIEVQSSYWERQPLAEYLTYLQAHRGLNSAPDRVTFQTEEDETLTRYI